jgi:hypothetical protein
MSDKFLNTGGGSANISNGSATVYAATLGAVSLTASMPIKTNSTKQLVSEKLDINEVPELATGRIYDSTQATYIDLDGLTVAVSANDLTLNGYEVVSTFGGKNLNTTLTTSQTSFTSIKI